jgi:aryl-alcohol dehydrogenase-like predicted oxidoreductase
VPIIGITKPVYAERLVEALQVDLTPEEIEQLTSEAAATGIRQQGSWEPQ